MKLTKQPSPSLFIQFAGQGVRYIDDLRRLYAEEAPVRTFITQCIESIHHQADTCEDSESGFFFRGLNIEDWLRNPEKAPEDSYLLSSPLSHPLIFMTQASTYLSLTTGEIDHRTLLRNTHSATGFSTGVVAAVLFSLDLPYDELIRKAIQVQAMFFRQGIRTQQAMSLKKIRPELKPEDPSAPSCMASITNIFKKELDVAIDDFGRPDTIYPAYEILPGRWIVAGGPDDLDDFQKFLMKRSPKFEWRYIPSSIAAHSPYLQYALDTMPLDVKALGLTLDTSQMHYPVFSNENGNDLRESPEILNEIMRAYFIRPAVWKTQIQPLFEPSGVRYVLDFGPGPGVAGLTERFLTRTGIPVIRCGSRFGRKQFFDQVAKELAQNETA